MTSSISKAREAATSVSGDYLNNDWLISNQLVFVITDVREDEGGFGPCWRLNIEPYAEDDEDPLGILTMPDNPSRRKFMVSIGGDLDEKEIKGEDVFIGPCVLVKLKGKRTSYMEIVDWDEANSRPILPPGAQMAGRIEEEVRVRRPRASSQAPTTAQPEPTPQPTEQARPFVEAVEAKAEPSPADVLPAASKRRSQSRQSAPDKSRLPVPTPDARSETGSGPAYVSPGEFPPIKVWAKQHGFDVPEGRGRVKADIKEAYERAKKDAKLYGEDVVGEAIDEANNVVPLDPTSGSTRGRTRHGRAAASSASTSQEDVRTKNLTRPAQVGAGAPARTTRPPEGGAQNAQEMIFAPGMQGRTLEACDTCNQHISDRIFPTGADGEYALIHTCPNTNEQAVMPATPVTD